MTTTFYADGKAVYAIEQDGDDVVATALRTGTVYRSTQTMLEITGTRREQSVGIGGRVFGARARLLLDTGEGMSTIPGVAVVA